MSIPNNQVKKNIDKINNYKFQMHTIESITLYVDISKSICRELIIVQTIHNYCCNSLILY